MKKIYNLLLLFLGLSLSIGGMAQKPIDQARIYVNPGHGGWNSGDRNLVTINHALGDTTGFYETNTNMHKGLSLQKELEKAGAYVKMSRTLNGIVAEGSTPNALEQVVPAGQIVSLSEISMDANINNMDYFLSIHSNAAIEGAATNFPLLLYRGTDDAVGNGLTEAKNMGIAAWKHIVKNGVTYYSHYTGETQTNVRGDISFMNGQSTVNGFTGYYGVLKHGVDGFLSEGCFHTYHPERHRLLNADYCRQEGVRYARAIRSWFGDNTETKGSIMGTVKDKNRQLEHKLYVYKTNSIDAFAPVNDVTVVLNDAGGVKVGEYKTDKEHNGIFVFNDLAPGTYTLVYDFLDTEFFPVSSEIVVVANQTSFTNQLVDDGTDPPYNFLDPYYPAPKQDGDIVLEESYDFLEVQQLKDIEILKDLTIRRAILRGNKYYILAVDATKAPKLLVVNPTDGTLIKEMSTTGLETNGYNGKELPYILSDIAFTTDGVLIGTNSTVIGVAGNVHVTGDFCIYKWQAAGGGALEDATPQEIHRSLAAAGTDIGHVGNNNSNYVANTIAVKGNINDFYLFFNSHAGSGWDWTTWGINWVTWRMTDGKFKGSKVNYHDPKSGGYIVKDLTENFSITYSPLGDIADKENDAELYRFMLDGKTIKPVELKIAWDATAVTKIGELAADVAIESSGSNYFRYLDRVFMAAPVVEKQGDDKYSYKAYLYDITEGLSSAKNIGETEALITDQPAINYMAGAGVTANANIELYLMVGNNIVKYRSKDIVIEPIARILASDLKSTKTGTGYDISYVLNSKAKSVDLVLTSASGTRAETILPLSGLAKGENAVSVPLSSIPGSGEYTWAIKASADNIKGFVKLSDDSEKYQFFGPKGIAVDKSPESKYFGRTYITNADAGTSGGRATSKGIYILGVDGTDVTSQGNTAYAGDITWASTLGQSPRKVAVAADGRVFISDHSIANSGIYQMDTETFAITSLFPEGVRGGDAYGNVSIGGKFAVGRTPAIGVRGEGESTQLYAVDASSAGKDAGWKKNVSVYNIGTATVLNKVPNVQLRSESSVANENASLVPTADGYWAAQFRGGGSNSVANPCMFYHSDAANKPVFNSKDFLDIKTPSENGGLAVNEKEGLVALSNAGGVSVYSYVMDATGVPIVTEKFSNNLQSTGVTYDDFEFDYAGNLYAVSYSGKLVTKWAIPTTDNTSVVPAQNSMRIVTDPVSIEETEMTEIKVYPTLIQTETVVEFAGGIEAYAVYDTTGALKIRNTDVNQTSVTIDFSSLPSGVYFINVNNAKTVKVIKR